MAYFAKKKIFKKRAKTSFKVLSKPLFQFSCSKNPQFIQIHSKNASNLLQKCSKNRFQNAFKAVFYNSHAVKTHSSFKFTPKMLQKSL